MSKDQAAALLALLADMHEKNADGYYGELAKTRERISAEIAALRAILAGRFDGVES